MATERPRFARPRLEDLEDRRLLTTLYAVQTGAPVLISFDSANPGTILSSRPISTGQPSTTSYLDIDFRPATGQLYAFTSSFSVGPGGNGVAFGGLAIIDVATGHPASLGSFASAPLGIGQPGLPPFSIDFDPTQDQARAVSTTRENLRVNPVTGSLISTDTNLAYAVGDPNAGQAPTLGGIAYSNDFAAATSTTLYGVDTRLGVLVTQSPANGGVLHTVGPLGINATGLSGFDIVTQGGVNTAYAAVTPPGGSASQLFTVNLTTGAATLVGTIGGSSLVGGLAARIPGTVPPSSSIGRFDPGSGTWYLRNQNSPGTPDAGQFRYGGVGWLPVVGDWDGNGSTTVGVVDPNGNWYLRNSNNGGPPNIGPFPYGLRGWIPVAGDWNGTGHSGIGVYDPNTATWYLRDEADAGPPDAGVFQFGVPGWLPVVGDWDGNGTTTIGVVDPNTMTWYLRNSNSGGLADIFPFQYGGVGWKPVAGDWSGNGPTTIGVVDPNGNWYLRNENSAGTPDAGPFPYGLGSWTPVAGDWSFPGVPQLAAGGAQTANPDPGVLSQAELDATVSAALARLSAAGVAPSLVAQLSAAHFAVADLGGAYLGLTLPGQDEVLLSPNAAGWGWYIDTNPLTDSAFTSTTPGGPLTALPGGPAAGRMDLLTVVLHEMGHLAGRPDDAGTGLSNDLMAELLATGVRRTEALDQR